jgi:chaperonin cofactor prefoldin
MGLFWDLIQQSQISGQSNRADSLEQRVAELERQTEAMNRLLRELVTRLEQRLGEDVNRDGRIG